MLKCRLLLPVLTLALSACVSNVSSLPHPSEAVQRTIEAQSGLVLRIAIPRRRGKRGHYISPATRSIAIAIKSKSGTQDFNADLTPATNPDCSASYVCTIALPLAPGRYRASFITYDGPLANGNGFTHHPTGKKLSANGDVPLHVRRARMQILKFVLGGIPARAALTSYGEDGFSLSKCVAKVSVGVFGVDADDNVILGPGAPSVGLTSSDTTHLLVTETPSPRSPNTFVLSSPNLPAADSSLTLTGKATSAKVTGIAAIANAKQSVTFNQDVCGAFTHFTIPTPNSLPFLGIKAGPDGAVWFTEYLGDKIGRVSTNGAFSEFSAGAPGTEPADLAVDSAGALWFTAHGKEELGKMTTSGSVDVFGFGSPMSGVYGIAIGADGFSWWTAQNSNEVGYIHDQGGGSYAGLMQSTPTADSNPVGIALGSDGNLWFAEFTTSQIGRITDVAIPKITEYPLPSYGSYGSGPYAITGGSDGALWFTECYGNKIGRITTAGKITEFPVPTAAARPRGIASGPDGALWFTEFARNKIGRITTAGSITEYPITGTSNPAPIGITTGPDHNLWFTESASNQIGRLQ